jgi:predicted negative regulator of RcsB-dependent stress response
MPPTYHLNALIPRVRTVNDPDDPDNSLRNIVLAVIFSIFGAICLAVGIYIGCLYWRKHKREQRRRSEQVQSQQALMKNEQGLETLPQY